MRSRVLPLILAGGLFAGCATDPGPKPDQQLQATRTAITEADRAGAQNVEPAMLTGAREKLDSAAALIEQQEYSYWNAQAVVQLPSAGFWHCLNSKLCSASPGLQRTWCASSW